MSEQKENAEKKRKRHSGKRKLRYRAQSAKNTSIRYPLLCFDTETTNHGELLELAIYDQDGREVFHKYFRPHASHWPVNIHHITPEKVADCKRFIAYRHEVQRLLNSTDHLVGCALSNDLHTLRRYGVNLHGRHKVHDIQKWHWLLNDTSDRHTRLQSGLSNIADHYGLEFTNEGPHSATADTKLTLDCFMALVNDFYSRDERVAPELPLTAEGMKAVTTDFDNSYLQALQLYRMHNLAGYINVKKREQGYSFKFSRGLPDDNDKYVLSTFVNDRVGAEHDMRDHFASKQVKGFTGFYELDADDFEYIRNYSNQLDLETYLAREKRPFQTKDIKKLEG